MRSDDGCGRLAMLTLGVAILLVFVLPTAAFGIATNDWIALVIAAVLAATGLWMIDRAVRG